MPYPMKIHRRLRNIRSDAPASVINTQESSSDSSEHETICYGMVPQEHARPRLKAQKSSHSHVYYIDSQDALSTTSLASSIYRFRGDFESFKCKIRVFGESLQLCRCIADDFRNKIEKMEKRLERLEKRQKTFRRTNNYSTIIQKNKLLAKKSQKDVERPLSKSFECQKILLLMQQLTKDREDRGPDLHMLTSASSKLYSINYIKIIKQKNNAF